MSHSPGQFFLPRPGASPNSPKTPVSAPDEKSFTDTFGTLLPPAKYLKTANGKAAYYDMTPSPPTTTSENQSHTPDRVLVIHGVQTPALGMFPLAQSLQQSFPSTHFVLVDLWGHGLTETPVLPHETSLFHSLIDALLDHLEWPSAHLIGYSFGGALTVGYASSRPERVKSFVLVAPAGLIRRYADFTPEQQAHLRGGEDEVAAHKWVVEWLEGGDLLVPTDWKERVAKGEVVAQAVKKWQMENHAGHTASVVGVFRDGGVMDNSAVFEKAVQSGIPSLAVLGAQDPICSEEKLANLGFKNVVVPQAGHAVVRENVPEVAGYVKGFWMGLDKA